MSKDDKGFDPEDYFIDFTVRIIQAPESLPRTKVGNHITGQLIETVHDMVEEKNGI